MAKTTGPLLSLDAHGSLAKTLAYSSKRTGKQCRRYNKPLVTPSAKQRGQRRLTEFLVAQWQNMSPGDKATWEANAKASGLRLPGYHYFLKEAQRDLYTHTGLCSYHHLNEYVGGKIKDLSGNNIEGTPKPNPPPDAPTIVPARSTRFGNALSFNGVDEYIECAHNNVFNFGTGNFTIIYWLMLLQDLHGKVPMSKSNWVDAYQGWVFYLYAGGYVEFISGDGSASYDMASGAVAINTWHQIIARRIGTVLNLKINMVTEDTVDDTAKNINSAAALRIGTEWSGGGHANVRIDEVATYNRGLSDAELATRYKFAK